MKKDIEIEISDVTWTYRKTETPAITNLNIEIKPSEIIFITGPAGAGKTTLCRFINSLIPHFYTGKLEGKVVVRGMDTAEYPPEILCGHVGLIFDNPSNQLFNLTVYDEIAFGPENLCIPPDEIREIVADALKFCRLETYVDKTPHHLSGGEQQACALASIMAMRPQIYVLDEPTANLDPHGTELVFNRVEDLFRTEKKTGIIVEHKLEQISKLADRMIVLDQGKIILEGKPREVMQSVDKLSQLGLKVPQATLLAYNLQKKGINLQNLPTSLEEGIKTISGLLDQGKLEVTDKNADQRGENIVEKTPNEKEVLIDCQDIWYTYPDGTEALKGVNLKIHKGDFLGLIGRNGSGKTTLAKIIKGLYSPTKGKVLVSGTDLFKKTGIDRAKTVGYVFQNPDDQIFSKTIRDEIGYGLKFLKLSKDAEDKLINKAATTMELQDHLDKNPFDVSQGLRQRVAIASVLIFEPEIFIIDEPTTGQDFARSKIIMDMVRTLHEIGKTIIIVTHDMELIAEYAKRLIVMKSGKMLLDGSTRNVFSQPKMLQESSIKPPQITSLGQALSKYSVPPDILTVEEMESILTIKKVS
ncbi:ATP-binding cassette domain-containing protein [Candidatus Bathyarchaeota archaeon]|nr:ATP-binding cassette domain-containing protein [Candidatus Bathyarchaeota archaeon]